MSGEDSTGRGRGRGIGDGSESTLAVEMPLLPTHDQAYLLVFEGERSSVFKLPHASDVTIGRGEGVELRLTDTSVSRTHARISLSSGEARISDLDSQNGTFVNGEKIVGARRLLTGDIITICTISLVYHASVKLQPRAFRQVLPFDQLRRRCEEEIERALRYQRPLTVLVALLPVDAGTRSRITQSFGEGLRLIDVVGWGSADQMFVLMPETDSDAAPDVAARILVALSAIASDARVGFATCPQDGCDVETLLASAREAATAAPRGQVHAAARTYEKLAIGTRNVIVADPAMTRLFALIQRLAASDLPVLVCGETGTGKELAASAVHHWSARAKGPMIALNCAALHENLLESELFGHEKGAFSGAGSAKTGLLEAAEGGTVFLDEIGEMSPATQAKLLRVLETKKVIRLGDIREREIDLRLVAATNRTLPDEVAAGRFRQDLYFRLSGATLWLPPLRDRKRELPILAQTFLAEACETAGRDAMAISDEAMQKLATYSWPGNVRELRNVMQYVAAAFTDKTLYPRHLTGSLSETPAFAEGTSPPPRRSGTTPVPYDPNGDEIPTKFRPIEEEVRELERRRMTQALAAAGGNQTRAADLIGMPLRTFQTKLRVYDLPRPTSTRTPK